MELLIGKYKSETSGLVDAVWMKTSTSGMGMADLNGTPYTFYAEREFIETAKESRFIPKITDYFSQELKQMTITFKE